MQIQNEIIELIYDVPLGKSQWSQVLDLIRQELKAKVAVMYMSKPNSLPVFISTLISDEVVWKTYEEYYWELDPWNFFLHNQNDVINFGRAILPEKQFQKTEYYNDFWKLMKMGETIGGQICTNSAIKIQIGFPREINTKNYNDNDVLLLSYYCSHIKRAIELEGLIGHSLPNGIYGFGLTSKFGLTPAEAQLVLSLFKTNSLKNASDSLNRSYHTVRTQLKSVFQKTESNNQLQLLHKLTRL